jgi:hypothetical protein
MLNNMVLASEIARNVIYKSIKKIYYEKLDELQRDTLNDNEIINLVNDIYRNKQIEISEKIRQKIKKKMVGNKYPGDENVEILITDILEDEDLAKERVKLEIKLYQKNKLKNDKHN